MPYFVAKSLFSISIEGKAPGRSYEELTFLVEAEDLHKAFEEACIIGLSNESGFVNIHHRPVTWKFEGITCLEPVKRPQHGCVLLSELKEDLSSFELANLTLRIARNEEQFANIEHIPDYIP